MSKTITVVLLLALMLALMPGGGAASVNAASCYWAQFVADVTVPDGTHYAGGTTFKKTWRLKNIGSCAWNSNDVSLIFASGDKLGGPDAVNLPTTVNPGQTVDISLDLTAPSVSGHYIGYYKFKSAQGGEFGIGYTANKSFWVEINVNQSSGTGYDFTAEASKAAWTSGAGALTFPGTDGDAKGFALKQDTPKLESGTVSSTPGLLFAPNNVTNGYVQGVYPAFKVQNGDRFQATIGCEQGATNCYVAYRLDYQIGDGPVKTFWTFREKYEGLTYSVNLNLSALAGQDVKFILVTSAYGSPVGDRAIWVNPIISRAGGNVTPPPPPPTTQVTPPPSTCDRAQFIADVTVPDGTSFAPAFAFSKTWRLKNVGTCTWSNYSLIFDSGEKMGGPDSAVIPTTVAPGQTVDITIQLNSPNVAGTYRGYWKLKNNNDVPFGLGSTGTKSFWVEIKVAGTGTVPTTPVTPSTPGTPATPSTPSAGKSYDFVANACTAKWYSGAGELPCPGTDGDAKGFVLTTQPSKLENGTSDSRAGLLTVPQNVNNGYIQGIYPAYKVKSGDKFRTLVNCEHQATSCYVVFRLDYSLSGSSSIQTYWAFVEKYEGGVYAAEIDLGALVGKDVKFILSVLATGSAAGDRALWVEPYIYNPATAASSAQSIAPAEAATSTPTPTATTEAAGSETPTATSTATPTATATP